MERLVEENLTHSFCSTCKRNVMFGLKASLSRWDDLRTSYLNVWGLTWQTPNPVASSLNTEYRLCDSLNSVAVPMGMMNIMLHLTKLPTQYQFVSVVCHVSWTDTPFGFCMLTSVDKMFIRFIFAKDMQLHYIWYYKILIKTCSCYRCEASLYFSLICGSASYCKWDLTHFSCPPYSPPQHMNAITLH